MAERKKKEKKSEYSTPQYMTTWGDMQSLLLTFFIFLFAISTVNPVKFNLILSAFRGSFGVLAAGRTITKAPLIEMGLQVSKLPSASEGSRLGDVEWKAIHILRTWMTKGAVRVRRDERGVRIIIASRLLFDSGSAYPKPESRKLLSVVAKLLKSIPDYPFRIEGHTDKNPIKGKLARIYPSNWELSAARAAAVARILIGEYGINPKRVSIAGYGSTRPICKQDIPECWALNRRVEIVILSKRSAVRTEPGYSPF